ncbi:MAG: TolC family protein, partial [Nevskiales bacterium]
AQQLPDPQLIAGIQDLPINTRDAYSLRRDSDTQLQLGLMQEFPRAKKRRLRGELVERDAQRLEAEHHLAQRTIRRDAALAWLELWRYTQSLQLTRASLHEADTQVAAVEIALKTGSATQADLLSARVEVARLQDEVAGTEQSIGHARNLLSRWIGEAAWRPIAGTLPQAPAEPSLNVALEHVRRHPHLAMHQAQIAAAQTGTNLAKADYDPDWRVELGYANRPAFSDMLTLQFGVDLPVFTHNRQDRALASALARQDAATAELEDGRRQLESEARLNLDDRVRLSERLKHYDEQLLPQAGQRVEATLLGWRAGRGTLAQILEARRAALDLQMSRLDLQHDAAKHFVQLTYLGAYETAVADLENNHE